MDPVVVVENVGKTFNRYHQDRPSTIQEAVAKGLRGMRSVERFWGLRDVSFTVGAGRTVGIVGANGSGKSTLLRLIGKVGRPDTGRIEVHGRVGALLDLGAGFHNDLTGRENAVLAGILNGLSRKQVFERLDQIVEFAEVEKAIDSPIRAYSSGMRMRLAFSVAAHTKPDLLLIDEVLSVGDVAFQRKCMDRIAEFKASGCSIIYVSHDETTVEDLCDEAIWLSGGRIMARGNARDVVRQYTSHMGEDVEPQPARSTSEKPATASDVPPSSISIWTPPGEGSSPAPSRVTSPTLEILEVHLDGRDGKPVSELPSGQPVRIVIVYVAAEQLLAPIFEVRVLRDDGLVCYDFSTRASRLRFSVLKGPGRIAIEIDRVDLNSGYYAVDVACYSHDWTEQYDSRRAHCQFVVRGRGGDDAVLNAPHHWTIDDGIEECSSGVPSEAGA